LCITIAANIAETGILGFDACFPDSVVGLVPFYPISDVNFFDFFFRAFKNDLIRLAPATAQKNINLNILNTIIFPLPPLNEQKRIVEKVDQLMALCDELERNIEQSKKDSELLMQSVLQEAFREAI
jgi:type I restriction enzyme S subunit